jgi:molybdopterin-guanine dinucleotide biosynthesis protein A
MATYIQSMNAFVLAGGRSTRMGRDKALIEFRGRPLIEHALDKLRALGFAPRIAGSRQDLSAFAPVIPDNYGPDNYTALGPLAGIEAALAAGNEELSLFLPVDLPLLPVEFLRWMSARALQTAALATIPRLQGWPQPLCAVYHRALLPHARAALAASDAKVMRAVEHAAAETHLNIDAFDIETIASSLSPASGWGEASAVHRWFQNLNTPADLQKAALEESPFIH